MTRPPAVELYTMPETAEQLRVSRRWLQDFIKEHPFYRMAGRKKLFSAEDVRKLHEAMPRPEPIQSLKRRSRRAVPVHYGVARLLSGGRMNTVEEAIALARAKRSERQTRQRKPRKGEPK